MYQMMIGTIFISTIIIASWLLYFYTNMINRKIEVENSWRIIYLQLINLQLKIRSDLIQKYLKTISSCQSQEKELLNEIMKAEHNFINAATTEEVMKFSLEISCGLEKLLENSDGHEKLNCKEEFIQLIDQLKELNEKVQSYYILYDDKVMNYNNYLLTFPNTIASKVLGIKSLPCFFKKAPNQQEETILESKI